MTNATKGVAVSTPNQLLAAVLAGNSDAASTAPMSVWHEALAVADSFNHAQYCAMVRGDDAARTVQLQLLQQWSAVYEGAVLAG
jgi:hypothetical protein